MEKIIFYLIAAVIIVFSVLTVTSRRILRAAVYLLFVLLATAGFYFMLNYNFLGAVQLTVYSGGIVVLIVFAILLTAHMDSKLESVGKLKAMYTAALSIVGFGVTMYALKSFDFKAGAVSESPYDVKAIGTKLLSYGEYGYVLPFEVISVLLLGAIIAAIIIAKKSVSND
ncbi:MAG: NADH-quinone oxidoreductase subunit J [Bacteroidota bacterium]